MCVCVCVYVFFCLLSITRKLRFFNWQHYPLNTVGFWLSFDCFFALLLLLLMFSLAFSSCLSFFFELLAIWSHSIETIFRCAVFLLLSLFGWQEETRRWWKHESNEIKSQRLSQKINCFIVSNEQWILAIFEIATPFCLYRYIYLRCWTSFALIVWEREI